MLYQVRSFNDLCASKKYLKKKEVRSHISSIVKATEKYRKENQDSRAGLYKMPRSVAPKVTAAELYTSLEVIEIDETKCNMSFLFPQEQEIGIPIKIEDIEKARKAQERLKMEAAGKANIVK